MAKEDCDTKFQDTLRRKRFLLGEVESMVSVGALSCLAFVFFFHRHVEGRANQSFSFDYGSPR